MLRTIFIKCKVDVIYFIFIFISPSVPRFSMKKSVNQLIKKIKGLTMVTAPSRALNQNSISSTSVSIVCQLLNLGPDQGKGLLTSC